MKSANKEQSNTSTHFLPPHFETAQARWVCMWQDRLEDAEARSARLEATIASLRQEVDWNRTDRIVLNQPCVWTKHHACFFSVPVFTNVVVGAGTCRNEVLQHFADALGRWLPGGDDAPCETPWGFELSMSPFGDVWPGQRTKRPISYIDGLVSADGFAKDMHVSLAEVIQNAWIGLIVKPTPLHELCVDTDRSHDGVVEGFIGQTPHFLVLQVFLREADNYGCFRNDGTIDNSRVKPPRWTPNGYDYHDDCDMQCLAPYCLEFGPAEWTNAFLDALAINKLRLSSRQSRRKIKEVLDKLGRIPRARGIHYSVD